MLANAEHEVVVYGKFPARRAGFDGDFERIPAVAIEEDPVVPLDGPAAVVHVAEELLPGDEAFGVDPAAEAAIERKEARLEQQFAGVSVVQRQAGLGSGGCPIPILVARGRDRTGDGECTSAWRERPWTGSRTGGRFRYRLPAARCPSVPSERFPVASKKEDAGQGNRCEKAALPRDAGLSRTGNPG